MSKSSQMEERSVVGRSGESKRAGKDREESVKRTDDREKRVERRGDTEEGVQKMRGHDQHLAFAREPDVGQLWPLWSSTRPTQSSTSRRRILLIEANRRLCGLRLVDIEVP